MSYLKLNIALLALVVGALDGCGEHQHTLLGGSYYLNDYDDSHVVILKKKGNHLVQVVAEQVADYRIEKNYLLA